MCTVTIQLMLFSYAEYSKYAHFKYLIMVLNGYAKNGNIIYIYEEGILFTFDTETNNLFAYPIDLDLKNCELVYDNELIYIIGGQTLDFPNTIPSNKIYSVSITEFDRITPVYVYNQYRTPKE